MISTSFASCTHHLLAAKLTGLAADDPVRNGKVKTLKHRNAEISAFPGFGVSTFPCIVIVCETAALHFAGPPPEARMDDELIAVDEVVRGIPKGTIPGRTRSWFADAKNVKTSKRGYS